MELLFLLLCRARFVRPVSGQFPARITCENSLPTAFSALGIISPAHFRRCEQITLNLFVHWLWPELCEVIVHLTVLPAYVQHMPEFFAKCVPSPAEREEAERISEVACDVDKKMEGR